MPEREPSQTVMPLFTRGADPSTRRVGALAAALMLLALSACDRSDRDLLERAAKAANQEPVDLTTAQRLLDEVVSRTSESTDSDTIAIRREALILRGVIFRRLGLVNAAESDFKTVLEKIDSNDSAALIHLATACAESPDDQTETLEKAIVYADRAFTVSRDAAAKIAAAFAHIKISRHASTQLNAEINALESGADLKSLDQKLTMALSAPPSSAIATALDRELDAALSLRTPEVRLKVAKQINSIRDHLAAARIDVLEAFQAYTSIDVYLMQSYLDLLRQTRRVDDGLFAARLAMHHKAYWGNPFVMESAALLYISSRFPSEASALYLDYLENSSFPLEYKQMRVALRMAIESRSKETLTSLTTAIRKTLRRDPDSQILAKIMDYGATFTDESKDFTPAKMAERKAALVKSKEEDLAGFVPPAALEAAKLYHDLKQPEEALRMLEFAFSAAPNNAAVLASLGTTMLMLKRDPLTSGRHLRFAMVHDPVNAEKYYPLLREAAERLFAKTGSTIESLIEDSLVRGESSPKGFIEGWIYYVVSRELYRMRHYEAAASAALDALSRDGQFTAANLYLGLSRARLGQAGEAQIALLRAIPALPNDPEILRDVVESGLAPRDYDLMLLASRPDVDGRIVVARSFQRLGRYAEAQELLKPIASIEGTSDEALLLAASVYAAQLNQHQAGATPVDPAVVESLLSRVNKTGDSAARANQIRLELAVAQNNETRLDELIGGIELNAAAMDRARLIETWKTTYNAGKFKSAVKISGLLERTAKTTDPAILKMHGCGLLASGDAAAATRYFDRLSALDESVESSLLLAAALDKTGNNTESLKEVLQQLRQDWGVTAPDFRRMAVALWAGENSAADEVVGARFRAAAPASGIAAALLLSAHPEPAKVEKELGIQRNLPWLSAAIDAFAGSPLVARRALRAMLLSSCEHGAPLALAELRELKSAAPDNVILQWIEAEALSLQPATQRMARDQFVAFAKKVPSMDLAWQRALELARASNDNNAVDEIVRLWTAAATPANRNLEIASMRHTLDNDKTELDASAGETLGKRIRELLLEQPKSVDLVELQCRLQTRLAHKSESLETARSLFALVEKNNTTLQSTLPVVCNAFQQALPDSARDAVELARKLKRLAPRRTEPVQLMVSALLANQRYAEAADEVLTFLRRGTREEISAARIETFVREIAKADPVAAAEIARLSVASEPGEPQRWNLMVAMFEDLGQSDAVLPALAGINRILTIPAMRTRLGSLLAHATAKPEAALEVLSYATATAPASKTTLSLEDSVSCARALRTLKRAPEGIELLEKLLGAMPEVKAGLRLDLATIQAALPAGYNSPGNAEAIRELALCFAERGGPGDLAKGSAALSLSMKHLNGESLEHAREQKALVEHMRRMSLTPADVRGDNPAPSRPANR